jgi:PhnB protein
MSHVPAGQPSLCPYLIVHDAGAAIDFYARVFGATERMRLPTPDGRVMHADIAIGDAVVMLSDPYPEMGYRSARDIGATPVSLMLYVPDVDATVALAQSAGAVVLKPAADMFWGDRMATVRDPFGLVWSIATHMHDVPPEEVARRGAEWAASPT